MLRAVLVGLLGLSSITGCKGKESDQVATTAAGKVLEVSGQVTVKGKALAVGDKVAADDEIETGADGRAVIELAHNSARWELGPNKKQKVSASIAWNLPKQEGQAKAVDQDTAAAGRPAERSAAEATQSTAPAGAVAPAPTAPEPPPPPSAQPAPRRAAPETEEKKEETLERSDDMKKPAPGAPVGGQADSFSGDSGGGAQGAAPPAKTSRAKGGEGSLAQAAVLTAAQKTKLHACLGPRKNVKLTIHIDANGKALVKVTPDDKAAGAIQSCAMQVLENAKFPKTPIEIEID